MPALTPRTVQVPSKFSRTWAIFVLADFQVKSWVTFSLVSFAPSAVARSVRSLEPTLTSALLVPTSDDLDLVGGDG